MPGRKEKVDIDGGPKAGTLTSFMWQETFKLSLARLDAQARRRKLEFNQGVSFSHNDYLGLSDHPDILAGGRRALERGRAGSRGSRLLGGHEENIAEAEEAIAKFFNSPAALLFSTGYQANLGLIQALGGFADHVVSDAANHASLIDGIRLTGLERTVLAHQEWNEWNAPSDKKVLLVAESLYSMDGDCVQASDLQSAWLRSGGFLVLDEAHAAGVFGPDGRGLSEPWRDWNRMAVVVTFGKAFGVSGGAVLCSSSLRDVLVNTARTFIYTTAQPPVVPALICASLEVMREQGQQRRQELWKRSQWVRELLQSRGVSTLGANGEWDAFSPIIPVFVPGNDRALRFSETMRSSGWDLRAIRYPTVPQGLERIRISLNLSATWEQTESMALELVKKWKAFS